MVTEVELLLQTFWVLSWAGQNSCIEYGSSYEGIKLSAEVKPFVPKYAAVTVAWSEPSEACVFPRYYATCYPYVQEPPVDKQQVYSQDVPWDTTTSLSQYPSQNLTGYSSLGEYTSSPHSLDAAPNVCAVTNFQHENNSTKFYSSSKQDKDSAKQTFLLRKEASNPPRRRPKDHESKWESKRPDGGGFSSRSTESSSCAALHARNPIKSDRPIKALNGKFKQIPNTECLPEPAFEIVLSDFPKLQSLGSSDLLELQKRTWEPLGSAEGDKLPLKPPGKSAIPALVTKEGEVSQKKHFPARPLSSSSDPGVPQVSLGFFTETPMSWATVLSQTPKRVVSTPATVLASNHSSSKGKDIFPEALKSGTRENASDNELEEMVDKKKKQKKKKKEIKPSSEVKKVQEPPRIEDVEEFPNLAAAADKKYKPAQKLCCATPIIREQAEVIITRESGFESHSGHPQNELVTPKPDLQFGRKAGKQVSPTPIEKKKMQEPSKASGKKSQIPVQLDLGGMVAALEQKQHTEKSKQLKPVVLSVGGAVTLLSKESMIVTKSPQLNQGKTPHNPLDSSAPLVKKGKQREVPKAKKPTSLKKIILKEREQRKQQHLLEQTAIPKGGDAVQEGAAFTPEDQVFSEDTKTESADEAPANAIIPTQCSSEVHLECTELSGSTKISLVPTQLNSSLPKIHSRRFRDYCTQVLSKEVDSCVTDLLKELVRFQDRLYQKDPVKAKTKRRLVMGLREVLKHLKLKKLKCVIISPNCEKIQSKGGLDETLHLIIDSACEQNIPFVFALNRKALGRCVNKTVPVSVVGIFSYDGAQDYFHKMVELTMEARVAYKEMIAAFEKESAEEENESDFVHLKTHDRERSQLDIAEAPLPESDEDVPNYIKIWKRKLEEEYNPYMLELEK
ncbi:selenocysteine insertion sequence-binding protein 2 isoform X2 [Rhineura floridana]|uniref:selenocysteine insertion sequence-binding protein 2 isoform X2 n=1 Tax=Rhineura floridana TaxID=261503 RepID=UPI002AC852BA|nr:selenocysteine insertion sequence-binding protein 2 isoform X2 [Rhineura floridana]